MNPFNDEYFMKQALVEARAAASEGEVPVGAVGDYGRRRSLRSEIPNKL